MKTVRSALATLALATALESAVVAQARAATPATGSDSPGSWSYVVKAYLLSPSMTGTSGVNGLTSEVSADAGEIFGVLDFGGMLYLEMENSKWAVSLDATYMDLGASAMSRLGSLDAGMRQGAVTLAGYRRVRPWAEALLAVTINGVEASLEGSGPTGVNVSTDQRWADPFVGVRLTAPREDKLRLRFLGTVGGFGVGSDFAWQMFPEAGYQFSPLFEVAAGFRWIYMDYTNGSGSDEFTYQVTTYGPQLGAVFHF